MRTTTLSASEPSTHLPVALLDGDMQQPATHHPTTTEIVQPAMVATATQATGSSTEYSPHSLPCTDLEGNEHELLVVPLGGRVALACPEGATALLSDTTVYALAESLPRMLVATVHAGTCPWEAQELWPGTT